MKTAETDGQRFGRVLASDVRVRSISLTGKVSQRDFERKYAEAKRKSAGFQRKPLPRKSAALLAAKLDETVSFVERARFIIDHGTYEIKEALLRDSISFQEAWRLAKHEKEIGALVKPKGPGTSTGAVLVQIAGEANSFLIGSRWTEDQRDLAASIGERLLQEGHITEIELEGLLRRCFRRKSNILGGSSMSETQEAPHAP